MYYLITGGAGSGKSEYAEALAVALAGNEDAETQKLLTEVENSGVIEPTVEDNPGRERPFKGEKKRGELYYIATMFPYEDLETKKRIERHRLLRAGKGFVTIERPLDIGRVTGEIIEKAGGDCFHEENRLSDAVVLLEDLTNLYANECYETDGHIHEIAAPLRELSANVKDLIVVANELYSDGREYPEETEKFLRNLGELNREMAGDADRVIEVVAGLPVNIK
ncbi:hypothetical protein BXO88_05350 [Oribacterium sp. C9]|uniref:bifunctional adenosylcobinamide kinase/adenosylcobinamide-phosphate guanylyltransferase n=1 Tax=Oribacterium sp. C9 TaxID=1943579 RepID=UPI00098ED8DF|nr:bifunctional adenosylcobinamide kinase/adenosylcobinamide-phosphate guanylyltransferase [Oribacterium sp. C9]OON86970.1 hypothetical protein BXO88_05350 [Oribacterium sp. C9]